MITQYTRLVVNKATQEILHCTSQDFPFADGWEPIGFNSATEESIDFEIETSLSDVNFQMGVDQPMIRAREILDNFEIVSDQPKLKTDSVITDKVLSVSAKKSINDTNIRTEHINSIKTGLSIMGTTDVQLLEAMRKLDPTTPEAIEELKTTQLIRIKKTMGTQ